MISPTRDLPNARKDQWSFDVQRELSAGHRARPRSTSARTPAISIAASSTTRRSPGPAAVDPRRPSQKFRSRRIIQNDLIADYDAVSVILRKRMSHGLQADVHYTWSRTRDMATHSNGGGQTMNNYDIWADYGPANWDVPHRFVASYIYDVPFLKTSSNPVAEVCAWPAGRSRGVTTLQSGTPVNVTSAPTARTSASRASSARTSSDAVPALNCQPNTDRRSN